MLPRTDRLPRQVLTNFSILLGLDTAGTLARCTPHQESKTRKPGKPLTVQGHGLGPPHNPVGADETRLSSHGDRLVHAPHLGGHAWD